MEAIKVLSKTNKLIDYQTFESVEMRVGIVKEVADFPEARKPAYKLIIDFGPFGIKKTSAQITDHYNKEDLEGRQVIAVTNFPPKKIAGYKSEVLVLGTVLEDNSVKLIAPDSDVPPGTRIL